MQIVPPPRLIVPEDPTVGIHYSVVTRHDQHAGRDQQHHRHRVPDRGVVDRTVRTLRAAAHLADVQQVRLQRVEQRLVEAFCRKKNEVRVELN